MQQAADLGKRKNWLLKSHSLWHALSCITGKVNAHRINYSQEIQNVHCVSKKGPTLKRYSSKLYGSILMIFGRNIQKSLK